MLENGLTEVPERFIQPSQVRMSQTPCKGDGAQIPLKGLSRFGSDEEGNKQVVTDVGNACSEWGFVQVLDGLLFVVNFVSCERFCELVFIALRAYISRL